MKLDRNDYKRAMSKVNVSEDINQSLLQKSKDTDYERWLVKRSCREERKKAKRWIVFLVIVFGVALYLLFDVIYYNRFFNHLEKDGICIVADYCKWHDDYEYSEKGKKGKAACTKNILFKNQGETTNMYYIGNDFSQAIPLLANWVWVTAYVFVGNIIILCIIGITFQIKRLIRNKI